MRRAPPPPTLRPPPTPKRQSASSHSVQYIDRGDENHLQNSPHNNYKSEKNRLFVIFRSDQDNSFGPFVKSPFRVYVRVSGLLWLCAASECASSSSSFLVPAHPRPIPPLSSFGAFPLRPPPTPPPPPPPLPPPTWKGKGGGRQRRSPPPPFFPFHPPPPPLPLPSLLFLPSSFHSAWQTDIVSRLFPPPTT